MHDFYETKKIIRSFYDQIEGASSASIDAVLRNFCVKEYDWFGVHPFNKLDTVDAVIEKFWKPLFHSWSSLQRRQDIFLAGRNEIDGTEWCISMGHLMGFMHRNWLGIPPIRGIAFLRYADFHCVKHNKIQRTAFFCDIISLMNQAKLQVLPMQTASSFLCPGPRTHDGLLFSKQDPKEGEKTLTLVNKMIADLDHLNKSGNNSCTEEFLERTWQKNMIWYGPAGIGTSYTIAGFQKEHQFPFRMNLKDKVFHGHICRLSEGNYAGFFGWPNLTNVATGGFLGMTANNTQAEMRVVDIYRREGDKLAENWVIMDILHWLKQQGLDILKRTREITS